MPVRKLPDNLLGIDPQCAVRSNLERVKLESALLFGYLEGNLHKRKPANSLDLLFAAK
jgi:hypothetical protein